jgi:diguanylate cyclase (GGDEF)-like protein
VQGSPERDEHEEPSVQGGSRQATVLIVDDEAINIRVVSKILGDRYQLRFADTGERALEIATSQQIDLVLLDVVMPGMDGYEVCRQLKEGAATRDIPVIFVTARGEVEDEARGFALGGVDYITKPVSPPLVQARVKTHLELKEQRDLLEELSMIDVLTKIPNRRRFDDALRREIAHSARARIPFTLVILDVDFFKQYNDAFGHTRGDECLRAIADALATTFSRPGDLVARYGGEEFAAVLRDTDFAGACTLVDRVHHSVLRLELEHPTSTAASQVTVSAGGVSLVPKADTEPAAVLEAADRLLYEAKQGGRWQGVCVDLDTSARRTIHGGSCRAADQGVERDSSHQAKHETSHEVAELPSSEESESPPCTK